MDLGLTTAAIFTCAVPLADDQVTAVRDWLPERLHKAAAGRIDEFLAGRYCALMASKALAKPLTNLTVGDNRGPLWPDELVGSISHTKSFAMAAVDLKSRCRSLGIDVESIINPKRFENIQELITTSEDRKLLQTFIGNDLDLARTIVFSAKESLYKALNPLCSCFIEFQEASMAKIDLSSGKFVLKLHGNKPELNEFSGTYEGQFIKHNEYVITGLRLI
jgi:enterobactin synthetase component D